MYFMEDGKIHNFDLLTLLKLGDLDIRKTAKDNPALVARNYFTTLSEFIDFAPRVRNGLTKIADLESGDSAFQNLASMKTIVTSLSYDKLVPAIDAILEANEKGNTEYAAQCAKSLLSDFEKLYTRLMSATRTVKSENLTEVKSDDDSTFSHYSASFRWQTLEEILEKIDDEESKRMLRILAVDDSPTMLKNITHVLGRDYKVFTLSNPTMVEKFLRQITPELFLLDYKMPEINGFELIPIIRSFEEHKNTPIIFLTSMGTNDHVSAAAMLGVCDFIVKPFEAPVLQEKVAKYIVRKKLF